MGPSVNPSVLGAEVGGDLAFLVEETPLYQLIPDQLRSSKPEPLFLLRLLVNSHDLGELTHTDKANAHAGVAVLPLEAVSELAVRLICHNGQLGDPAVRDSFARLVYR